MLRIDETRLSYAGAKIRKAAISRFVARGWRNDGARRRLAVLPNEYIGLSILAEGVYERAEIRLMIELARRLGLRDTVCLDIGANIGNHATLFARHFAEVVAFEPNPPIAALLKANVLFAGLSNVRIHEVGLGQQDADLPFGYAEESNDGAGSFVAGKSDAILPVRNGDAWLAAAEPALASGARRIGYVKCDVEGFEEDVFVGLRKTLAAHRPIVSFETNETQAGQRAWTALRTAGYDTLHRLRHTGDEHGTVRRQITRLFAGHGSWIAPVDALPAGHANLIASFGPLPI